MKAIDNDVFVIDSGCHSSLRPFIISSKKYYYSEGNVLTITGELKDYTGHGTGVCGVICKYSEYKAKFHIANIFNRSNRTSLILLQKALEDAIALNCSLIHCSFSYSVDYTPIHNIIKKLTKMGAYIIASTSNDGKPSFPAMYPEVIGVSKEKILCNTRINNLFKYHQKVSSPILIKLKGQKMYPFKGTSLYAAYFTGLLIKYKCKNEDILQYKKYDKSISEKIYLELHRILISALNLRDNVTLEFNELYERMIKRTDYLFLIEKVLHEIEKKFQLRDWVIIQESDILNAQNFYMMITKNIVND